MKNIEKYKDIVLDNMNICDIDGLLRGKCTKEYRAYCEGFNCTGCKERFLKWLLEECKESVLDEVERKYLSDVIRPFRKNVIGVCKHFFAENNKQFISISVRNDSGFSEYINLPNFNSDTMYKGMKAEKWYTLEELCL